MASLVVGLVSGALLLMGAKTADDADRKRDRLLTNVVNAENLQGQPNTASEFIVKYNADGASGLVNVFKQEVFQTQIYNFSYTDSTSRLNMTNSNPNIRFEYSPFVKRYYWDKKGNFGTSNFQILDSDYQMNSGLPKTTTVGDEKQINDALKARYGQSLDLPTNKIYKMNSYCTTGTPMYLSGSKVGGQFIANSVSTDPNKVADYVVGHQKKVGEDMATVGLIGLGALALYKLAN